MVDKCKNCGEKIDKYPLFEGEGKYRKFLWKNLFKISLDSIIMLVILIALILSYRYDIAKCEDVIEDPCTFCDRSGCCSNDFLRVYNRNNPDFQFNVNGLNLTVKS